MVTCEKGAIIIIKCWISYRKLRSIELSNFRYIVYIERVLPSHPLASALFFLQTLNESFEVSRHIENRRYRVGYRIESFDLSKYRTFDISCTSNVCPPTPCHPQCSFCRHWTKVSRYHISKIVDIVYGFLLVGIASNSALVIYLVCIYVSNTIDSKRGRQPPGSERGYVPSAKPRKDGFIYFSEPIFYKTRVGGGAHAIQCGGCAEISSRYLPTRHVARRFSPSPFFWE